MRFPRQQYWGKLPFLSPGDLPNPGTEPMSPSLASGFFTIEPLGKPSVNTVVHKYQNTRPFQVHIEHSPGWITGYARKQVLINLRKLKLHQTSFGYNIVRLEINKKKNCKKHKHIESKQLLLKNQWVTEEIK